MTPKGPRYLRIRLDLMQKIQSGEWPENSLIPTEMELSKHYGVSRGTIRKAIESLVEEKYLIRKQGFGTTVYQNKESKMHFTLVQSLTNEMIEMGIKLNTLDIELRTIPSDQHLASIFGIDEGSKVYNLQRVRGISFPILYSNSYLLPVIDLPKDINILKKSLYQYLADNNIVFTRFQESVSAMLSTEELAEKLDVEVNTPLLKRVRCSYNAEKTMLEYTITYYVAAYYEYRSEINYNSNNSR